MNGLRLVLVMAFAAMTANAQQTSSQQVPPHAPYIPASCPVTTRPAYAFIPPGDYPTELPQDYFWMGTDKLWTEIREGMTWEWRPHRPGHEGEVQPLTVKIFWFRLGYDYRTEPHPKIKVTGKRLDGPAPPLMVMQPATHALFVPLPAMLTGVFVPMPGCWEITGDYEGDKLSFVVWVAESKQLAASR